MPRRNSIICICALGLLVALAGVRNAISETRLTDLLIAVVLCAGMATSCIYDARCRGKPMTGAGSMATFFLWPIAVPAYLVWSRGWKRGLLLALGYVVSLLVLYFIPFFVAGYTLWGAAFFRTG